MVTGFGSVEALVFDMFGTVVDWRTNVAAEVASLLGGYVPSFDAYEFADAWRAEYQPSMERVRKGDRPFVRLDVLHRENLDTVLEQFGTDPTSIPEHVLAEVNLAWHRLGSLAGCGRRTDPAEGPVHHRSTVERERASGSRCRQAC
jgi:2-haloacid dehalogenase